MTFSLNFQRTNQYITAEMYDFMRPKIDHPNITNCILYNDNGPLYVRS